MTDKILCPWCGAEMDYNWRVKGYAEPARDGWYECKACGSKSPTETGEDKLSAMTRATVRALRRYTPPIKPMTLEEVRENNEGQMWLELSNPKDAYMQGYCELMIFSLFNGYEEFDFYPCGSDMAYDYRAETYNVKWRCWERKPTKDEMEAAEWET